MRFLKQQVSVLGDRDRLVSHVQGLTEKCRTTQTGFTVVVIDCSNYLKELSHERPNRIVAFYMDLYSILQSRLRSTDLVARVSNHRFVAILASSSIVEGTEIPVIEFLRIQVKQLQEEYKVFQSHPIKPEGFQVLAYPEERSRIWSALSISDSEVGNPEASPASKHDIEAA